MTASPASPSANAPHRRGRHVLAHDEAAGEADRDRLEAEHERRQRAAHVRHRVRQQPGLDPESERADHDEATYGTAQPAEAPARRHGQHGGGTEHARERRGRRPDVAQGDHHERERHREHRHREREQRERRARRRRHRGTSRLRPRSNATALRTPGGAQPLDGGQHATDAARIVRVRAEADGRARAADRRAQQLHELGEDAHVGAVDLERGVARSSALREPVEALAEVGRYVGAAHGQTHGMADDVVAAMLDGVGEAPEVVVPGGSRGQRHRRVEDRVVVAQAVHGADHDVPRLLRGERVLRLRHARVVGPVLELEARGHDDARHGLRRGRDLREVAIDADRRALELAIPAVAEIAAGGAGLVEMEDVLGEREAREARRLGRAHHAGGVAVRDEVVVVVVDSRHRSARASASRKAPAISSRDQSWQS